MTIHDFKGQYRGKTKKLIADQILSKALQGTLNFCKLQTVFKSLKKFAKCILISRLYLDSFGDLVSGIVWKYTIGRCNSSYCCDTDGQF